VKPDENDGFEVMFDIHFERDDETPFNHVMRHPLADEVDDYKAYKYCSREQRNAEKHGALRLGSLNYRTTSQMNLSEKDFQEQFRRPSDVGKDHLHFEEPRAGRTPSLHRMEIVAADHQFQKRTLDGSAEETDEDFIHALGFGPRHAQNEPMPPQKHRGLTHLEPFSALHALHSHRRGESYDGITDETVLAHPRTQLQSDIPPSVEQVHNHPSMVTTHFESINWNPAPHFYEVDWNPPPRTPPRRQSRVSNAFSHVNLQCLDKTSEPTSPTSPDDCAK
jgi:hypothetical protein